MAQGCDCLNIEKRIDNAPSVVQRHDCQNKEKQKKVEQNKDQGMNCFKNPD